MEPDVDRIIKEATAELRTTLDQQRYQHRELILTTVQRFGRILALLENMIATDPAGAGRAATEGREEMEEIARIIRSQQSGFAGEGDIDEDSLAVFALNNGTVAETDAVLAETLDNVPVGDWGPPGDESGAMLLADKIKTDVAALRFVGVTTLQDLEAELAHRKSEIAAFSDEFTQPLVEKRGKPRGGVTQGQSVTYLANLLAAQTRDPEIVKGFLRAKGLDFLENLSSLGEGSGERYNMDEQARRMIQCYESVSDQ